MAVKRAHPYGVLGFIQNALKGVVTVKVLPPPTPDKLDWSPALRLSVSSKKGSGQQGTVAIDTEMTDQRPTGEFVLMVRGQMQRTKPDTDAKGGFAKSWSSEAGDKKIASEVLQLLLPELRKVVL